MRALLGGVIAMAVLIVISGVTLITLVAHRLSAPPPPKPVIVLTEPAGTQMVGVSSFGPHRMAVQLRQGGPDRVVIVDTHTGRPIMRLQLAP